MQLWQSDITQYTLGPASMRVYLTVFMDDHSRYIVGWRLQPRQTAELVLDAFRDACVRFGKPAEVLTDQGRQYFAWRGKSELEKLLEKEGIKHVVSRAHLLRQNREYECGHLLHGNAAQSERGIGAAHNRSVCADSSQSLGVKNQ